MADLDALRRDNSLARVASDCGLKLQPNGREWECTCPLHAEDTPSFTIYTGNDRVERFFCFGCKERGDVIDFVQAIKGVDKGEAIRILGGEVKRENITPRQVDVVSVYDGIEILTPPDAMLYAGRTVKLYNPKRAGTDREWGSFSPSAVYPYRSQSGALLGYVLRHNLPGGDKETPMVMYVRLPDGKETWCRFPFPKPRTLYGLETIRPSDKLAVVVEGEKCRDALAKTTNQLVVSWAGGSYGVRHADWSPLAGRKVMIWADADKPGVSTMHEIAAKVLEAGGVPHILTIRGYT